mgnify:FL=1
MNVQFVRKSSNAKTGPIPTTTSPRASCPTECPLAGDGGCYAEAGYYTRMNWDKVDSGERGLPWAEFLGKVRKLPEGQLWRHNVAGDLPQTTTGTIDSRALWELVAANTGRKGFTYTHYAPQGENLEAIEGANRAGFTVNISANTISEARALRATTSAPVVTLVSGEGREAKWLRDGDVVQCPAEYREDISCATCQLCQKHNRKDIVGFTVHGTRKANANIIARG